MATALEQVVDLNESAKKIRGYAFEVSLSALGAIVRCSRSGHELPGFNEVAVQMRQWSRDLAAAVADVNVMVASRVRLVSELVRRTRLLALLDAAHERTTKKELTAQAHERAVHELARLSDELARADVRARDALESIEQLGLMASVLSRAALIEAASGTEHQRRELTIASQEFATYADSVNEAIAAAKRAQRGR